MIINLTLLGKFYSRGCVMVRGGLTKILLTSLMACANVQSTDKEVNDLVPKPPLVINPLSLESQKKVENVIINKPETSTLIDNFNNLENDLIVPAKTFISSSIISKYIKDDDVIQLLNKIIGSYSVNIFEKKGLPIGNLTSQLFTNIYNSN